jgi:D-alanyl-lipoteichoic acid acyltransferase DltB (MBOAT superfamily)
LSQSIDTKAVEFAGERTPALEPAPSKIAVATLSLGVIACLVGHVDVITFLLGIAGGTYLVIALADRTISDRNWRVASAMFGALLALNVLGFVGNLTGNPESESLRNQWVVSIGIGFYTLQIIGVGIDVMRRRIALPSPLDYVFYILYLPKFLSGPIEQATFLARVRDYRLRLSDANLATGIPWLVLGMFMKFGVADIDYVRPLGVFVMTALFELRVYFDWAGYSLMAYGGAWCLGLPVMLNFAQPLFAHNPQALWQRWHISLGRWFREYLYLPLMNGIPYPILLSFLAPIAVFTISAMWHGVSFNFMLWGIFHATAYLLFVKVLRHLAMPKFMGVLGFIFLLLVGRLLFMDDDTDRLLSKIDNLLSWQAWQADLSIPAIKGLLDHIQGMQLTKAGILGVLVAGTIIFVEWLNEKRHPDKPYQLLTHPLATIALASATLLIASATDIGFVYARN